VRRYSRQNFVFKVQEIFSPHDHRQPKSLTIIWND